jgi:hypothetical protein
MHKYCGHIIVYVRLKNLSEACSRTTIIIVNLTRGVPESFSLTYDQGMHLSTLAALTNCGVPPTRWVRE